MTRKSKLWRLMIRSWWEQNCHWNFEGTTKKLSVTGTRRCPSAVYYVLVWLWQLLTLWCYWTVNICSRQADGKLSSNDSGDVPNVVDVAKPQHTSITCQSSLVSRSWLAIEWAWALQYSRLNMMMLKMFCRNICLATDVQSSLFTPSVQVSWISQPLHLGLIPNIHEWHSQQLAHRGNTEQQFVSIEFILIYLSIMH